MKIISFLGLVRKLGVTALIFWIAGAGCLLGCENMIALAGSDVAQHSGSLVVEGDACASSEDHSCCNKRAADIPKSHVADVKTSATRSAESASPNQTGGQSANRAPGGMKPCPFAISRVAIIAKTTDGPSTPVGPVTQFIANAMLSRETPVVPALWQMPNRGHTYLRCCSFLI